MALLHQQLDHVDAALGHAVGELLDGDGFRNGDLAHELFFRLVGGVRLQPLDAAAEGRDRALALLVGAQRGHDREPSAVFLRAAARRFRRRCRPRRAGTAACARGLVLVGLELGLEVVFAALLFVGFARLGGLAFGALGGLTQSADKRLLFRNLALLGFAQASVVERVHARLLLFLGEAAQHHTARRLAGGGGSGRGGRRGRRRRGGLGGGGALGSRRRRRGRDRLRAAVAETLAHDALLDPAPFEGQGLARAHAELLFASLFRRFSHSNLNSRVSRRVSSCSCVARLGRVAGMTPAATRRTRLRAGPKIVKARGARQKPLAFGTGEQGCMYHI